MASATYVCLITISDQRDTSNHFSSSFSIPFLVSLRPIIPPFLDCPNCTGACQYVGTWYTNCTEQYFQQKSWRGFFSRNNSVFRQNWWHLFPLQLKLALWKDFAYFCKWFWKQQLLIFSFMKKPWKALPNGSAANAKMHISDNVLFNSVTILRFRKHGELTIQYFDPCAYGYLFAQITSEISIYFALFLFEKSTKWSTYNYCTCVLFVFPGFR